MGVGMDERSDPLASDPKRSAALVVNQYQRQGGANSKTLGHAALSTTRLVGSRTYGNRLLALDDTHCVVDGVATIDVWSETAVRNVNRDKVPEFSSERLKLPLAGADIRAADAVYCNGYIIAGALLLSPSGTTYDLYATVIDAATYSVLSTTRLATGLTTTWFKLAAHTTTAWAVYFTTGNTLAVNAYVTTSHASGWPGNATAITDFSSGIFGAEGFLHSAGTEPRLLVAYWNTSGGADNLSLRTFDAGPTLDLTQTLTAPLPISTAAVTARRDGSNVLWIGYFDDSGGGAGVGLRVLARTSTLTSQYTVGTVIAGASAPGLSAVSLGNRNTTDGTGFARSTSGLVAHKWTVTAGAVAATGSDQTWYTAVPGFSTRPWYLSGYGRLYTTAAHNNQDGTLCAIEVTTIGSETTVRPVAVADRGLGTAPVNAVDGHAVEFTDGRVGFLSQSLRTSLTYGLDLVILGSTGRWLGPQEGGSLYMSGAIANAFDGGSAKEIGFVGRPSIPLVTTSGTGLTLTNGARWVAVYEFFDDKGNVEWSSASDPSAVTTGANVTFNVATASLAITAKYNASKLRPVRVAFYRTDDNGGVGPYYRAGHVNNVTTAATVTFADTLATATLLTKAVLYTDPGVLGTALNREGPPASIHLFKHSDRLMAISDDGESLWFSGPKVAGEQFWFNVVQQLPVPGRGRLVAGWSQDSRAYVASPFEIFVIDGEGPPENGGNGTEFSAARKVSSDVGCIDARSLCSTNMGTFFQSHRGIELMTRSGTVEWVGAPLQETFDDYPVITSAVLDLAENLVIFTAVEAGSPDDSRWFMYDLSTGAWTIDKHFSATEGGSTPVATGACMVRVSGTPRYHWLADSGVVYRRRLSSDASAYLDTSTWRTTVFETQWVQPLGPSSEMQVNNVQILFRRNSSFDLACYYAVNGSSTYVLARTYTAAEIDALTEAHLEVALGNDQKGKSYRFKFVDATPTGGPAVGTGQGATFVALTLKYNPVEGERRLASGAR